MGSRVEHRLPPVARVHAVPTTTCPHEGVTALVRHRVPAIGPASAGRFDRGRSRGHLHRIHHHLARLLAHRRAQESRTERGSARGRPDRETHPRREDLPAARRHRPEVARPGRLHPRRRAPRHPPAPSRRRPRRSPYHPARHGAARPRSRSPPPSTPNWPAATARSSAARAAPSARTYCSRRWSTSSAPRTRAATSRRSARTRCSPPTWWPRRSRASRARGSSRPSSTTR